MLLKSVNPKNGKVLREAIPFFSRSQIDQTINSSYESYLTYKELPLKERLDRLGALSDNLERNVDTYAKVISKHLPLNLFGDILFSCFQILTLFS